VEAGLAAVWAAALGVERVGVHDNFFELGGDSILSIQVVSRAAQAGVRITARQLFQHQTVAELAAVAGTVSSLRAEQGEVSGSLPLTPIQRWFFAQEVAQPHHYNQSMLLEVRERLAPAVVQDAVAALLAHHDALRMRFARTGEGWAQVNAPAGGPVPFEAVDLSYLHGDDLDDAVERACALRQAELALDDGPLLRALLVDRGAGHTQRLFVCAHHLVVDGVSWRVLLEDLETACRQLARGEAPRLPLKTTSFREWAAKLAAHAGSGALRDEVELWADGGAPPPLPVDHAGGGNTVASAATVQVALDEEETRALLTDVPPVYGTQVNDVLLAALARAFAPWTGSGTLLLELEGHGREDLFDDADVSRTVGWFTSAFPVEVEVDPAAGPGEALRAVKEQLRRLPGRGIGWGLLRWMGDEATRERLAARPSPEVSFNYFGQFDGSFSGEALFAAAAEGSGEPLSPAGRRPHLIEINGGVTGGRLRMAFTYSRHVHEAATVQRLADAYVHELRAIVEHCRAPEAGGYTPSDFPHLALDQDGLDDLLAELI
jgi:non-ribosomal peptide synthase protein (TIGR01720 family)